MPSHGQTCTRLVVGDPDRSSVYVWAVGGGLVGPYVWTRPDGDTEPATPFRYERTTEGWKSTFSVGARLPFNAEPGKWQLDAGRGPEWEFAVEAAPPPRKRVNVAHQGPAAHVTAQLAAGYDVELTGQLYEWTEPVILPPFPCTIRGYGAVIRRVDTGNPNDYRQRVFYGGKDFTLEGVTIYGVPDLAAQPGIAGLIFHAGMYSGAPGQDDAADLSTFTGTGLVVKRCTFLSGSFGYSLYGVQVIDCTFDGAGATEAPRGLWLRNQFRNAGQPHSFGMNAGCAGDLALIDNVFTNTARGPVFDSTGGGYTDGFFYGTRLIGIAGENNGCEAFMCEGGSKAKEFSRNIIFNTHYEGAGTCPQWDCPANDNLVADMLCRSPGGMTLYGSFPQERNMFNGCEWWGPIGLGPQTKDNILYDCCQRWIGPSRMNNGASSEARYAVLTALTSTGVNNQLSAYQFFLGAGMKAVTGANLSGCKVGGIPLPDTV